MPENKIHSKWIEIPASFREQIDLHYGTWVNMPYLSKLVDSPDFWRERYRDLAERVFTDWNLQKHLFENPRSPLWRKAAKRSPLGRPKEDNNGRDRDWLKLMDELTAKGISRRKASEKIARLPEAQKYNVTAKTILNAVTRLQKLDPTTARRADAETPARR